MPSRPTDGAYTIITHPWTSCYAEPATASSRARKGDPFRMPTVTNRSVQWPIPKPLLLRRNISCQAVSPRLPRSKDGRPISGRLIRFATGATGCVQWRLSFGDRASVGALGDCDEVVPKRWQERRHKVGSAGHSSNRFNGGQSSPSSVCFPPKRPCKVQQSYSTHATLRPSAGLPRFSSVGVGCLIPLTGITEFSIGF